MFKTKLKKESSNFSVLALLGMIGPLTIDFYLPAFSQIKNDLNASEAEVQFTLTGTIAGFTVGQILIGSWSDKVGRRKPLLISVALYVITCILTIFISKIEFLCILRILQGFSAAAAITVSRAAIRDIYQDNQLIKILGRMALITGFASLLAPIVGSQLLTFLNWRGLFSFLSIVGFFMLIMSFFKFSETLENSKKRKNDVSAYISYISLLKNKKFLGIVLSSGFITSSIFVYISCAPFIFKNIYGFNPQEIGLIFATMSAGVFLGMQVGARLLRIFNKIKIFLSAIICVISGGLIVLVSKNFSYNTLSTIIIPLWFSVFNIGICFISTQFLSLDNNPNKAGAASALLGANNFGSSTIAIAIVSMIGLQSVDLMIILMIIFALLALLCVLILMKPFENAHYAKL